MHLHAFAIWFTTVVYCCCMLLSYDYRLYVVYIPKDNPQTTRWMTRQITMVDPWQLIAGPPGGSSCFIPGFLQPIRVSSQLESRKSHCTTDLVWVDMCIYIYISLHIYKSLFMLNTHWFQLLTLCAVDEPGIEVGIPEVQIWTWSKRCCRHYCCCCCCWDYGCSTFDCWC